MAYKLSRIIHSTNKDPEAFAWECDLVFEGRISAAAEQILDNRHRSPIVLLSGPSASGKTTSSRLLERALEKRGVRTHPVSLDDYYLSQTAYNMPLTPEGTPDLESPLCLDLPLLAAHFEALSRGEEILVPAFDFPSRSRRAEFSPLRLGKDEMAVFEGIHALNDAISGKNPLAAGVYVCPTEEVLLPGGSVVTGRDVRFLRRMVRDVRYRATSPALTLELWPNVLRGETMYIRPFLPRARCRINSSFACDLPALRDPAIAALKSAGPLPEHAARLLSLLETLPPLPASCIGERSLLREFLPG